MGEEISFAAQSCDSTCLLYASIMVEHHYSIKDTTIYVPRKLCWVANHFVNGDQRTRNSNLDINKPCSVQDSTLVVFPAEITKSKVTDFISPAEARIEYLPSGKSMTLVVVGAMEATFSLFIKRSKL